MERKARENLKAAEALLSGDPCTNAAASRAYYAAYLACWTKLVDDGHSVPRTSRGEYFPHSEMPEIAADAGVLDDQGVDDLVHLESTRVRADYLPDDVGLADAWECLRLSRRLVAFLLGAEDDHGAT